MNSKVVIGLILIVIGIFAISYNYFPTRKERHSIGVGPLSIGTTEVVENKTDPLPIVIGAIAVIAGLFLVLRRR